MSAPIPATAYAPGDTQGDLRLAGQHGVAGREHEAEHIVRDGLPLDAVRLHQPVGQPPVLPVERRGAQRVELGPRPPQLRHRIERPLEIAMLVTDGE